MNLEFGLLNRKELRQAAELAARSFNDYEYFRNWYLEGIFERCLVNG